MKILFWRKVKETCEDLVEINQAEAKVENNYQRILLRPNQKQADNAKEDMKYVVGRGAAGQTLFCRDQEAGYSRQDQ